ncbi:hypothetical protein [Helicobacter pylori]|uniref:hypothetical protein n=1 Tax=Helicobacter pylori TaxID=210 RepID=UPI000EB1544F|nr:hypothetical protein [Helicobacter pylori]
MAINSRERIKYIHVTKYVTKLGFLQNKRQNQQQALLEDIVAKKNQAKTMKGNSNGTWFQ